MNITIFTFVLFLILPSQTGFAGTWSRLDSVTISFEGSIRSGDEDNLRKILQVNDRVLIVNSEGGDSDEGLKIGMLLFPRKLRIIVNGLCASACANYIFTAGSEKIILQGFVGFHGNMTAMLRQDWETTANQLRESGYTEEIVKVVHQQLRNSALAEQRFFSLIGVSQKLFDRTQKLDKGMGDGATYSFLCPSIETLKKYGIHNVSGRQDPYYRRELGLQNAVD